MDDQPLSGVRPNSVTSIRFVEFMRCSNRGTENEERLAYRTKCGDPLAYNKGRRERYGRDPIHLALVGKR